VGTDIDWKLVYVGSAESEKDDQVLDEVGVGPVNIGLNKFVLEVSTICKSSCGCARNCPKLAHTLQHTLQTHLVVHQRLLVEFVLMLFIDRHHALTLKSFHRTKPLALHAFSSQAVIKTRNLLELVTLLIMTTQR
jgi:hypothetical protein